MWRPRRACIGNMEGAAGIRTSRPRCRRAAGACTARACRPSGRLVRAPAGRQPILGRGGRRMNVSPGAVIPVSPVTGTSARSATASSRTGLPDGFRCRRWRIRRHVRSRRPAGHRRAGLKAVRAGRLLDDVAHRQSAQDTGFLDRLQGFDSGSHPGGVTRAERDQLGHRVVVPGDDEVFVGFATLKRLGKVGPATIPDTAFASRVDRFVCAGCRSLRTRRTAKANGNSAGALRIAACS